MKHQFQVEVGGFRLSAELSTTNVDTHSKVTQHTANGGGLIELFTENMQELVEGLSERVQEMPSKEVRLAEGCR